MPNLGTTEWVIILIALVVLFGSKKLTELAKGMGEGTKELKKAKKEFNKAVSEDEDSHASN